MTGISAGPEIATDLLTESPDSFVRTALLAGGVSLWEWLPGEHRLVFSAHLETLLGYPTGAFDGALASFLARVLPADRPRVELAVAPTAQAHAVECEFRLLDVHGTPRWLLARGRVMRDLGGNLIRLVGTMQEIPASVVTERRMRRQQDALVELLVGARVTAIDRRDAFRRITELAARTLEVERASIWLFDDDRTHFTCSNLYRRSLGQHMAGARFDTLDFPEYIAALEAGREVAVADARSDPRTRELTESYLIPLGISSMLEAPIRRDGRVFGVVCHEHVGPMRDWLLDERTFAASIADVVSNVIGAERRRELGEQLRKSEERYRGFVNLSLEAILRIEIAPPLDVRLDAPDQIEHLKQHGRVAEANASLAKMLGVATPDRLIGRTLASMLRPDAADRLLGECVAARYRWNGHETQVTGANGEPLWLLGSLVGVEEGNRLHGLWGTFRDITRRKTAEHALEQLARRDALTGLPNRAWLNDRLAERLAATPATGTCHALVMMDLDHFKEINDTIGHHAGDDLLKQMGPRLEPVLAAHLAEIARLGGDEFAILVESAPDGAQARALANAVLDALAEPFAVGSLHLTVDASLGIALYPVNGTTPSMLMRSADVAMYEAKRRGTRVALYAATEDPHSPRRLRIANGLPDAIRKRQIVLDFQPIFTLGDRRRIVGVEALARWHHPELGLIGPDEFIPLAEMGDQVRHLTLRVLEDAGAQWRTWRRAGIDVPVSINLSPRVLLDHSFGDEVRRYLAMHGMPGEALRFEITESAVLGDASRAAHTLEQLRPLGVSFAIDDFGMGFSSLAYLQRLPVESIKIDRSFVTTLPGSRRDTAIVRSTINLAQELGLSVVAEGVETHAIAELVTSMGCTAAQGFALGLPDSAEVTTALLAGSPRGGARPMLN